MVGILGQTMTSKIHSEFNWPLQELDMIVKKQSTSKSKAVHLAKSTNKKHFYNDKYDVDIKNWLWKLKFHQFKVPGDIQKINW